MARELELQEETKITITPKEEVNLQTDKISVDKIEDNGQSVIAYISFFHSSGTTKQLTLWEDVKDEEGNLIKAEYSDIGQWTDEDVNNRILELIK
ncbi:MAG: hypothetical protein IT212_07540 [Bacteroidia bacterium]|nr:hypothetical protein [Bacteroidia bacterium]